MSAWTRSTSFCACSIRAAFSRRHACQGPGEEGAPAGHDLERRRRHRLEEPAVVRDEDHRRVERGQLALEPLEARHVEVVRRLVEQQQVGVAAERARERGARQLSAGERPQLPVEVLVGEAEAAQDGGRVVAPAVAARVLEPRLRRRVAVERRLVVRAARHRLLEPLQLLLERDEVARAGEDVLAQRQVAVERRPLVVQRDPRSLLEGELAAVLLGLAGEDSQQRRLAGAVRPGERDAVAPLDGERDPVEEDGACELLAQVGGDDDCHDVPRVGGVRRVRSGRRGADDECPRARRRLLVGARAAFRRARASRSASCGRSGTGRDDAEDGRRARPRGARRRGARRGRRASRTASSPSTATGSR